MSSLGFLLASMSSGWTREANNEYRGEKFDLVARKAKTTIDLWLLCQEVDMLSENEVNKWMGVYEKLSMGPLVKWKGSYFYMCLFSKEIDPAALFIPFKEIKPKFGGLPGREGYFWIADIARTDLYGNFDAPLGIPTSEIRQAILSYMQKTLQ